MVFSGFWALRFLVCHNWWMIYCCRVMYRRFTSKTYPGAIGSSKAMDGSESSMTTRTLLLQLVYVL